MSLQDPVAYDKRDNRVAASEPVTRTEEVRNRLAEEITQGVLAPGTKLDETQLAERFGMSRTPVREALKQLNAMGLVTRGARRMMTVADISPRELNQLFEMMGEMEAVCARMATSNMTSEERKRLARLHEKCRESMHHGDSQGYVAANAAFHNAIYDGTHNIYVVESVQQLKGRLAPFRQAQLYTPDRTARSFEEHEAIVNAIMRGDKDAAAQATRAHMGAARETYANLYSQIRGRPVELVKE